MSRIQRRRSRGWRMPADAIYVGRPTPWGNPFTVSQVGNGTSWLRWAVWLGGTPAEDEYFTSKDEALARAVDAYRAWLTTYPTYPTYYSIDSHTYSRDWVRTQAPRLLASRPLACWCRLDQPCHADVLVEIANAAPKHVYTVGRPDQG